MELFSSTDNMVPQDDIDWLGDLKFFIDNDDTMLEKHILPAVKLHKKYVDRPDVYRVYEKPLQNCLRAYCEKFEIDEVDKKFPPEDMTELAKFIAKIQGDFIKRGEYENS